MIRASRRGVLAGGALAVPAVAGLPHTRWRRGEAPVSAPVLLHDPALAAGRRFAEAGAAHGGRVVALEGDRIRLARAVLAQRPAVIAGVSRHADALMIEDAARYAGYARVSLLLGRSGTCSDECRPGWTALGRMARAAGGSWVEALAEFAAGAGGRVPDIADAPLAALPDRGLVLGWVLAPDIALAAWSR